MILSEDMIYDQAVEKAHLHLTCPAGLFTTPTASGLRLFQWLYTYSRIVGVNQEKTESKIIIVYQKTEKPAVEKVKMSEKYKKLWGKTLAFPHPPFSAFGA